MKSCHLFTVLLALFANAASHAQTVQDPARGQLLYDTHCVGCHNQQIHWRQGGMVHDWNSLLAQVGRWQAAARLGWTADDIRAVARHLNDTVYRLPYASGSAKRE